jgi:hypothetical protein
MSLRNKFLIPMISLIVLGMGTSTVVSYLKARTALEGEITSQLAQVTESTQKVIDVWVKNRTLDVSNWSRQKIYATALKKSFIGKAARKSANAELARLKGDYKYYEDICVANKEGLVISASNGKIINKIDVRERTYFQESMGDKIYVSGVLKSKGTGNPVFVVSAPIDQAGTKAVCEKLGIAYNEKLCTTKDDIIEAVNQYKGKVSVIIIGNQALIIDNAKDIVKEAGTTPVVSYSSKPVKAGALGGFVADDKKLGYMLAESVVAVLKNGKAIKEVAVKVDPEPKFYVNARTAEALKIDIPFTILETATVIQ